MYILIIVGFVGAFSSGKGVAIHSIEFTTKDRCEEALKAIEDSKQIETVICVKG